MKSKKRSSDKVKISVWTVLFLMFISFVGGIGVTKFAGFLSKHVDCNNSNVQRFVVAWECSNHKPVHKYIVSDSLTRRHLGDELRARTLKFSCRGWRYKTLLKDEIK